MYSLSLLLSLKATLLVNLNCKTCDQSVKV